ncbi:hypothetical protein [Paenibacillus sp. Soil787]|uniref:hypothetical protein n=1 Tax=Paenibacillus sp. Soil787 TaxID=1736411 RepID=UPI0006FD0CF1|nr:hypothetical protein [Paenibacillus sp. Soil787]KRF44154.1 hypothetical protein ASG93_04405 [Paenibacillus sp. Soil787]
MELRERFFEQFNLCLDAVITPFKASHPVDSQSICLVDQDLQRHKTNYNGAEWEVTSEISLVQDCKDAVDLDVSFRVCEGYSENTNVAIRLNFDKWSTDNYVLMPSAVYNGNRFEVRKIGYPPQLCEEKDLGADVPTIISDVPRLNIGEEQSRIQLLTGDLATPAVGFADFQSKQGFWLLTEQGTIVGDSGITMEEDAANQICAISISAPGVREDVRYTVCDTNYPSEDNGADFKEGDTVHLKMRLFFFKCEDVQAIFDYFTEIRKDLTGEVTLRHELPFSGAWEIQENKYNEQNWVEQYGYYSVGTLEGVHQDWQIGWVGGLMATYPMLVEGSSLTRERALRNFDFVFNGGQDESGFFHGCWHKGSWYGDHFTNLDEKWHLIRKSSDALYYIIKQFMLISKMEPARAIPEKWTDGTRKCADAFVKLWTRYRQFGQFIDTETGEIIIGGSASAGIAPAGLALAYQFFGEQKYLDTAEEAAIYYYDHFVKKGYTTGGPGEILQCPDSESAFGLLESFVVLYEVIGEKKWLEKAVDMANQCFTWCVSYDFEFPKESTFGKLTMRSAGSVYANVQNKHGSPGICTLSGDSLFKLYRYTGNLKYLELIQEISHNLTQYLSREDRPILASNGKAMPAGWMNERVEMSDWLEPVGEIFYGSCWCEVSNMLTYAEVPGLYVQTDSGFVAAMDHIDYEVKENTDDRLVLNVINPTCFKAKIKVFEETSSSMDRILGQNALLGCKHVELEPQSSVELVLDKNRI